MKKLIILAVVLSFSLMANAQNKFEHFFGNVPKFTTEEGDRAINSKWLPRPMFSLTTIQLPIGHEARFVNAIGTGFSWSHFQNKEGEPYQDFAVTFYIMVGKAEPITSVVKKSTGEENTTEISVAAGITGWEFINVGAGYNFTLQAPIVLLNIVYSFN